MNPLDPHAISHLLIERLYWADIMPGMMFCFRKHIGRLGDPGLVFNDKTTVWTVIGKLQCLISSPALDLSPAAEGLGSHVHRVGVGGHVGLFCVRRNRPITVLTIYVGLA